MTTQALRIFGASLLLIGGIKAWAHSQSAGLLRLPSCLGEDVIVRVDTSLWHQVHCWGCYAALAGLLLIVLPSAKRDRTDLAKTVANGALHLKHKA